ncbi:MAG: glyoxylase family protein [Actinomycetota bacterium]|nr:glyoxylase family protein [Actinomycetota bacterium]
MFQFHHVALSVSDIGESIAFYGALGFREKLVWESDDSSLKIVHLSLGDSILELFCYAQNAGSVPSLVELVDDLQQVGVKHFALQVPSLARAKEYLVSAGLDAGTEVVQGRTGLRYFFVRDPDGLWLEIVENGRST